jgi:hypothetical protein
MKLTEQVDVEMLSKSKNMVDLGGASGSSIQSEI